MVLRIFFLLCLILPTLVSCSGDQGEEPDGSVEDSATTEVRYLNVSEGKELYKLHCIACHGEDGKIGIGGSADLTMSIIDTAAIIQIVKYGKKGMPAFKEILSNEKNILSLTAFVLELRN